ncbi:MAG: MFS transporter [Planctomycetaceae bacterium]
MSPRTFRLVLLVSCAHALVHVFELALPSVEQMIGDEFAVGKNVTGMLGSAWRLPFGFGAFFAGWLSDRYGAKPLLAIYLFGCAATSLVAWHSSLLSALFMTMFAMGCFASIYHPAGLALISHETNAENRGAALGWHGILGSLGIAGAPFMASLVFATGNVSWRHYYLLLAAPAAVLGLVILVTLREHHRETSAGQPTSTPRVPAEIEPARWRAYFVLIASGALQGCIYAPFMHFLPRYLGEAGLTPADVSPAGYRNQLAATVLLCGVVGQALAGRMARPGRLEFQLAAVLLANAPFLAWMAVADGRERLWASCLLALVHFMSQPVYNSLIAQYVPASRRSLGYGFNNMIIFGIGGIAPTFAGLAPAAHWTQWTYGTLAVAAVIAAALAFSLKARRPDTKNPA